VLFDPANIENMLTIYLPYPIYQMPLAPPRESQNLDPKSWAVLQAGRRSWSSLLALFRLIGFDLLIDAAGVQSLVAPRENDLAIFSAFHAEAGVSADLDYVNLEFAGSGKSKSGGDALAEYSASGELAVAAFLGASWILLFAHGFLLLIG